MKKKNQPPQPSLFPEFDAETESVTQTVDLQLPQPDSKFDELFARLAKSTFRSRFKLNAEDKRYLAEKGFDAVKAHAVDFVAQRLAPSQPSNDGKQTPMRGHPAFVAQHATGCCCRGCLAKWHNIQTNRPLSPAEQTYIVNVLMEWIVRFATK